MSHTPEAYLWAQPFGERRPKENFSSNLISWAALQLVYIIVHLRCSWQSNNDLDEYSWCNGVIVLRFGLCLVDLESWPEIVAIMQWKTSKIWTSCCFEIVAIQYDVKVKAALKETFFKYFVESPIVPHPLHHLPAINCDQCWIITRLSTDMGRLWHMILVILMIGDTCPNCQFRIFLHSPLDFRICVCLLCIHLSSLAVCHVQIISHPPEDDLFPNVIINRDGSHLPGHLHALRQILECKKAGGQICCPF